MDNACLVFRRLKTISICTCSYVVVYYHASIAAGVGTAFRHVCVFVHALTEKWLQLSTPKLVHVYYIAVT